MGNSQAPLDWDKKANWWLETKAFLAKQAADMGRRKLQVEVAWDEVAQIDLEDGQIAFSSITDGLEGVRQCKALRFNP